MYSLFDKCNTRQHRERVSRCLPLATNLLALGLPLITNPQCINKILNVFDEHEVAFIKESQFGKLVEIDWR
ncbi:hypothetical protein YC2023_053666 [Brassica napus]